METAADIVFAQLGIGSRAVPYLDGWGLQRRLHQQRVNNEIPDSCLLLEHEPVYTAGKRTGALDRPIGDPGAPVIDVDRGGKITWHGPGQLVGYPIIRLPDPIDVVAYVRAIEEGLIRACADVGVVTGRVKGRSGVWVTSGTSPTGTSVPHIAIGAGDVHAPHGLHATDGAAVVHESAVAGVPGAAGGATGTAPVSWLAAAHGSGVAGAAAAAHGSGVPGAAAAAHRSGVPGAAAAARGTAGPDRKVAAIGVRVARGVTMHGFAVNCDCDLSWFDRIVPCGIRDAQVTTLSAEAGHTISVTDMIPVVQRHLADALGATGSRGVHGAGALLARTLAVAPEAN